MSNSIAVTRTGPLADSVITRSVVTDTLLIVGGAALTGIAAQLVIPLWPVPITGQTLAVLLVASTLGAARAVLSMTLYALVGAIGVPWFSDASSGWNVLFGPSGGYILGFILAAALTGWLAQRSWDRRILRAVLSFLAGSVAVFLVGLPWLAVSLGLTFEKTLELGLYPFIVGGVSKAVVAAAIIRSTWFLVAKRRG